MASEKRSVFAQYEVATHDRSKIAASLKFRCRALLLFFTVSGFTVNALASYSKLPEKFTVTMAALRRTGGKAREALLQHLQTLLKNIAARRNSQSLSWECRYRLNLQPLSFEGRHHSGVS